jgi:hypothetical protein
MGDAAVAGIAVTGIAKTIQNHGGKSGSKALLTAEHLHFKLLHNVCQANSIASVHFSAPAATALRR